MNDIVSTETRSWMMSNIRGKNTRIERTLRSELHRRGYRFRLHRRDIPGSPDITLRKYHAVIFVHGCFWHSHNCHLFKLPATRPQFWKDKLNRNRQRDEHNRRACQDLGWRVLSIWECSLRGRTRLGLATVADRVAEWLESGEQYGMICGAHAGSARLQVPRFEPE